MDYRKLIVEHQRLSILRLLKDAQNYSLNVPVLQAALDALGLDASRDQVEVLVAWLAEQDLVSIDASRGVTVAKIKKRGIDVATGHIQMPGIQRPSPEE